MIQQIATRSLCRLEGLSRTTHGAYKLFVRNSPPRLVTTYRLSHHQHQGEERKAEEIRIPVPWGHIAGKWWGPQDKQPILALHGWLDNASTFDPLMALLPSDLGVLAIDLPGHGRSSHYPPGPMYHFTEDVTTVRRVVQHYSWEDLTIMGHSMGATYAFLYAACFPSQVKKIVTFDIVRPYALDDKKFVATGGGDIDKFIELISSKKPSPEYKKDDLIERQYVASGKSISKKSCEILLERGSEKSKLHPDNLALTRDIRLKYFAFYHSLPHDCLVELASRVKCDVVNIKAKGGLYWDTKEHYQETLNVLKKSAKSMQYFEVEGTHHVHLNTPDNVCQVVENFLCSKV